MNKEYYKVEFHSVWMKLAITNYNLLQVYWHVIVNVKNDQGWKVALAHKSQQVLMASWNRLKQLFQFLVKFQVMVMMMIPQQKQITRNYYDDLW